MRLDVLKVGKPAFVEVAILCKMYCQRLSQSLNSHSRILKDLEASGDRNPAGFDSLKIDPANFDYSRPLIALDQRGLSVSSQSIADTLGGWQSDTRIKQLTFLIGGPFGLHEEVCAKAHQVWCLSPLTLPSDFAWLICWEQLYRGNQILKGSRYHHG